MLRWMLAGALALACTPALAADDTQSQWLESNLHPPSIGSHMVPRGKRVYQGRPLEIRTQSQLLSVAERYVGSRRFTRYARAWCADAMGAWLRQAGYNSTNDGRAISYLHYGRPSSPKVGAIAVLPHHIGIVVGFDRNGVVLLSGNHGHRVAYGSYSARQIIAYREPS